jgi:hypothetical protein
MKKLFLLTTLLIASTITIHADLLNGPWSPESQELLKVIKDKNLPIPNALKDQQANVTVLRDLFENNKSKGSTDPDMFFFANVYRNKNLVDLANNNPIFLETFIQLLKQTIPTSIDLQVTQLNITDFPQFNVAQFFQIIGNMDLFKQAIATAPIAVKKTLLKSSMVILSSHGSFSIDDSLYLKSYNKTKEFIKILVNNMPSADAYQTIMGNSQAFLNPLMESDIKILPQIIEFLLSIGFPINLFNEDKETLLDQLNTTISLIEKNPEYTKVLPDINKLKENMISKGAKTYAELTAAQKGQR